MIDSSILEGMKVKKLSEVEREIVDDPLFTGTVFRQTPFPDEESDLSVNYIYFKDGVHNKMHIHSNDQILIVTEGKGIVATEDEQIYIEEGDVIHVPAGEPHWHGAASGEDFTHISITRSETKLTQVDK